MSKPPTAPTTSRATPTTIKPEDYAHSPVHYAVAVGDHNTLTRLVASVERLSDPTRIHTESDSIAQERRADKIAAVLDRRDNPNRETPLHLAVRLNDAFAVRTLANAGADISLQNSAGWNPLQEAIVRRCSDIVATLVQHHHLAAWFKWRRRLPRLVSGLRRMRDFYMEISFHFESSIVPFVGKIAPSDTYKIWKRDANLRADTSLAGYDGLKIQRANQSFLFFGEGDSNFDIPAGSLLVLNHDDRKIFDAFENAGSPLTDTDVANFCSQTSVYRPGMDVTKATLVGRTNWRGQEKTESVGEWKSRVYEVHNVTFSFRSRKAASGEAGSEQILPLDLEIEDDADEGFLVAENPRFSVSVDSASRQRRHSSFVREDREFISVSRKSVDIIPEPRRRSTAIPVAPAPQTKEKEFVKNLKPSIWLTENFPLKTEELLPLLDILANKVKAIRRMRELLTTKFPPGTFPVKVAIPVVPTVRVVITFTKFVELQPVEQFFTPFSSPRHLSGNDDDSTDGGDISFSSKSWLSRGGNRSCSTSQQESCNGQQGDPFAIPGNYIWSSFDERNSRKMKKCRSTRRSK
ncbi:ankyrin repeat domain-containing protein 13C [Ipomoea triloba]|uniref:ankyrin repeat domain-containing protein 13C n=1 Tax=Ipomoea triloba TaxID=35885 RepID=UPI00125DD8B5|nr:ankyrin repeat domain-containing protein 13C [Ipomoea triloba]